MSYLSDPSGELGISGELDSQRCRRGRGLAVRWATETQPRAAGAGEPRDAAGDADQELRTRGKERLGGWEMCHLAWVRRSQDTQLDFLQRFVLYRLSQSSFTAINKKITETVMQTSSDIKQIHFQLSSSPTEDKSVIILIRVCCTVTILTVLRTLSTS